MFVNERSEHNHKRMNVFYTSGKLKNTEALTESSWATYLFRCLDPGRRATLPNIQNARSGGGLAHISTERDKGCPDKAIIVLLVGYTTGRPVDEVIISFLSMYHLILLL